MDPIFKRIGNLFRSYLQDDDDLDDSDFDFSSETTSGDADYQAAWDELNNFMKDDEEELRSRSSQSKTSHSKTSTNSQVPRELEIDFKNLGVPFGASMDVVKKGYKKILIKYHPDRHAANPQKLKEATEITQRISHSFLRIKNYYKNGRV